MNDDFNQVAANLSENARFALQKADTYAKMYNQGAVQTEHLLLGILAQDTSTGARLLADEGVRLEDAEKTMSNPPVEVREKEMSMMSLTEAVVLTLRMANKIVQEQGMRVIGTEHILFALINQSTSKAALMLEKLNVDIDRLADSIEELIEKQAEDSKVEEKKAEYKRKGPVKWLKRYGQDLTQMARDGKLDTVIGRDREIERAVTVLCRRTKSNPVLIGEAGVGKTAIVEGIATRIAKDEVPGFLIGKRIYQVDLSSVVAGTKFRGEFEERIKGIIDEAMEDKNLILFIDEIHLLMGAGSGEGSMDAANILKPALARGQIRLIGATTMDEYRKSIEKDKALARRFQIVQVDEPSPAVTLRILKGVKQHYEKHHGVIIPDSILETAIVMAGRYINDRFMPDKVIDVIDEASAIAKVSADKKGGGQYKKLKIEIKTLEDKQEQAADAEDFERAAMCKTRIKQLEKEVEKLEKAGAKNLENPKLKEEDLANAISLKTGIPVSKVHGSEKDLLVNLEDRLNKEIIGQEEAVHDVAKAIRRGRSGISDPRRPIGSFLFMGPTGVGKTELARVIAKEVFGGDNALIKIDMSEFGEKHNVSRLVGAPAGYVGYDDGGKLTEAVRRHPYSVVLFDEIEKAHPDVFNMLLQILEDGILTDGQGNKVKFNNTVVILTSNLGASEMYDDQELGFAVRTKADEKKLAEEYEDSKNAAMRELKKAMRPELINRLDCIEVFHALTRKQVERIFDNLIEDLKKRLAEKSIGLKLDEKVKNFLIEKGYDPKNGARPLRRAIEDHLESVLSEAIIGEEVKKGEIIEAEMDGDDKIKVKIQKKEK
ncbi:ATP-dependent Clp protease ATP-binding subunit [Candidatus Saccharibacteria bacterium]|nr:ATP-dependent Clp protease ATP-binding subunit [Candidatus Saccharibacteria bacterium]